ncbi:hypothetical protein A8709_25490 [Paenibacillus pectinilyticus]|uniref:Uncharacterized protein n=2 Tax=Paenibacillus pectinilyticus TaxID=512399 RepID=A0A1C1A170_9BACL|nr:hypothetical protein A8709_25490 [Paenibacillus pectinilyticus]
MQQEVVHEGQTIILNAHLRIPDSMIDPSTTQEQFRASIDRHVFFWPTLRDCLKMLDTYARREPGEGFAVLKCDAQSLLLDHYDSARLSKYDSGSSPRYPNNCTYKKSQDMFLPVDSFQEINKHLVPTKASEIKEVLIEGKVSHLSKYVEEVYADDVQRVPERWRELTQPLQDLRVMDRNGTNNPS